MHFDTPNFLLKKFIRPITLLALGVITIFLVLRLGEIDISWDVLRQINVGYIGLAVAIHYSGFVVRGFRWRTLLAGLGHPLGFVYAMTLLMAGWFVSALVPARLGDLGRAAMLRQDHGIAMTEGLASIAMERALDIVVILGLAALAAIWTLRDRTPPWVWQTIGISAIFIFIAIIVLMMVPKLEIWLKGLSNQTIYQTLLTFGFDLLGRIRHLMHDPTLLLMTLAQTVYIWLCDVFLMVIVFLALGQHIDVSISAFASMAVDLAAAVPIVPGAIGQFEGAAFAVLRLFEISPQQIGLMVVLNRLISFWTFIVVSGLVLYGFGFSRILRTETSAMPQPTMEDCV